MTRKFDAVSITYVVNYTAFIESNILPDVFFAELQLLCGEIRTHLSMEIDSSLQVFLFGIPPDLFQWTFCLVSCEDRTRLQRTVFSSFDSELVTHQCLQDSYWEMDIAEVPVHNFVCACFAIPRQLTGTFDCDWISNSVSCAVVIQCPATYRYCM